MRYLLIFLLTTFSLHGLKAQTFSVRDTNFSIQADLSASFPKKAETRIDILQGTSLSMQWQEVNRQMPTQWVIFVCDPDACRNASSTGETFNVPGQFGYEFYASINPLGVPGYGEIWYDIWDVADDENKTRLHIIVEITGTGIEEELAENWSVSPNPTTEQTLIRWNHQDFQGGKLAISDLQGKILLNKNIETAQGELTAGTSNFTPGLYFVTIISRDGFRVVQKLLIN